LTRFTGISLVIAMGLCLVATTALACPSCAADDGGDTSIVILAGMIITPLLVAAITIPVVRRMIQSDQPKNLPDFIIHEKGSRS